MSSSSISILPQQPGFIVRYPWRLWDESTAASAFASVAYLIAGAVCLVTRSPGRFGVGLGCLFLLLGLDRFFGISARGVKWIRSRARLGGWYWPWRRVVQRIASVVVAIILIAVLVRVGRMQLGYAELLGVFAGGCSAALVLLRAISLHEFDMLLYRRRRFLGFRPINRFLEPFFPSLLFISALI